MLSQADQDELLQNIARRQPILQLTEERAALQIAKDREGAAYRRGAPRAPLPDRDE